MNNYIIYTDGSYKGSRKSGGGSAIICNERGEIIKELFGGFMNTTNNRMEIYGVLNGLDFIKESSNITIISDSQYVVNTINNNGIGTMMQNPDDYANIDLGGRIAAHLHYHNITIKGVKGHADNVMNNLADKLAQFGSKLLNLPEDEYFNHSEENRKSLVPESKTRGSNGFNLGGENGALMYSLG